MGQAGRDHAEPSSRLHTYTRQQQGDEVANTCILTTRGLLPILARPHPNTMEVERPQTRAAAAAAPPAATRLPSDAEPECDEEVRAAVHPLPRWWCWAAGANPPRPPGCCHGPGDAKPLSCGRMGGTTGLAGLPPPSPPPEGPPGHGLDAPSRP